MDNIDVSDAGRYDCISSNAYGEAADHIYLYVNLEDKEPIVSHVEIVDLDTPAEFLDSYETDEQTTADFHVRPVIETNQNTQQTKSVKIVSGSWIDVPRVEILGPKNLWMREGILILNEYFQ